MIEENVNKAITHLNCVRLYRISFEQTDGDGNMSGKNLSSHFCGGLTPLSARMS